MNKKNVPPPPKAKPKPFPPARDEIPQPVKTAQELIEELKITLESKSSEYFPENIKELYFQRFKIFNRDGDKLINYDELKELMVSVNQTFEDEGFLKEMYNCLKKNGDKEGIEGIDEQDFLIIISKKKKEEDIQSELLEAFKILDAQKTGKLDNEKFRELLMYSGFKYGEEECDLFMKEADPKKTGSFDYEEFVKKITSKPRGKMMMMKS